MARTFTNWNGSARRGRQTKLPSTLDPAITTSALLRAYSEVNNDDFDNYRLGKCRNQLNLYKRMERKYNNSKSKQRIKESKHFQIPFQILINFSFS